LAAAQGVATQLLAEKAMAAGVAGEDIGALIRRARIEAVQAIL
jgi:hypothetical protein